MSPFLLETGNWELETGALPGMIMGMIVDHGDSTESFAIQIRG